MIKRPHNYGVPFVSKWLTLLICITMLVFRTFTGIYNNYMMVFAGIYAACWYLRCMLVFAMHVGIYDPCWYLRSMLVFAMHAGIYDACWYLRSMLVFALHDGIYAACWHLRCIMTCAVYYNIATRY